MKEEKNSTLEVLSCIGQTQMKYLASKKQRCSFVFVFECTGSRSRQLGEICPEMQVNKVHALYDKHHKMSSFLKSHQNTHNTARYIEISRDLLQIGVIQRVHVCSRKQATFDIQHFNMAPRLSGQKSKFLKFLLSLNSQKRLGYKENSTKYRRLP